MQVTKKHPSPLKPWFDAVIEPRDVNFWLQKINPIWSVNQAMGQLVRKEHVAQEMVRLTFLVNRHFQMGQAGQHHPIWVEVNGVRYERNYSLTQLDSKHVYLTVKKVSEGKASTQLIEHSQIGDCFDFGAPFGEMQLNATQGNVLLLAAGSGITPMYSLCKQAIAENNTQHIELWYWAKTPAQAAFQDEFARMAQQHPHLKVCFFYTQAAPFDQRFGAMHLADVDLSEQTVFACGPAGFIHTVEELCSSAQQLQTEAFSLAALSDDDLGMVNITLAKSGQVLSIAKGQPILASLEQQQIKPEHGCRMGICNKCVCQKIEGSTKNLINGQANQEPGTLLKICVNSAQSDLVLDL